MGVSKAVAPDVLRKVAGLRRALAKAEAPEEALNVGAGAAGIEEMMRKSGFYRTEEIRPVRELFLDSRWMLGRMLRKVMRGTAGRPKKGNKDRADPNFGDELARLNLNKARAIEAQRIGTLPEPEKAKTYRQAETQDVLPTIELLIDVARPYWFQVSRKDKHRNIADKARNDQAPDSFGPFPLIYADPPWKFDVYSEKGLDRTPDQHYPTLSDEQIIAFEICGKRMDQVAAADAALLLWCTSSNIERALAVMSGWGFTYKSQAVWVKLGMDGKPISGLGLVFRNMHEVLLYGTRGNMPGPQYQPPSVFMYPRARHSAKPPEIRTEIERMYPDFDADTRLELFARETVPGWTSYGFEANRDAAE
jgi:N6-adenosine-specific RNA methylase IME4